MTTSTAALAVPSGVLGIPDGVLAIGALPAAIGLGIWALLDVERFTLFAVLTAMIIPTALSRAGGVQIAAADCLLVVALAAWGIAGIAGRASRPLVRRNLMLAPALVYALVNVESLAWSVAHRQTAIHSLQILEIVVVLPLVFASLPRSVRTIKAAMGLFVAATCVMAAIAFALYLPKALGGDLEGQYLPGQNKNTIGSYVGAGLVLAYGLWLSAPPGALRRLLAVAVLIEGLGLFASVSRGAILGTVIAVVVVSLLLKRRRVLTLSCVVVAAIAYLSTLGIDSNVDRRLAGSYDSSLVRQYSFEHAIDKIADRPILGSGAGTYSDYIPEIPIVLPDPNNMFLLTWAELGIVGVAALVFLLWRFARLVLATRRLPAGSQATAAAAGGVALSLFVHFQVDVTWTRGTSSLAFAMIGLMLATHRLAGTLPAGAPAAPMEVEPRAASRRRGDLVHA